MADALTIENTKEQQLEIELTVQGVDATKETRVCFCIETDGMTLSFEGTQGESDTWKFDIPVLSQLKRTSYDYKVVVVTDGYYFEPASGLVTIVGPHDIYTSAPKNVTLEPKKAEKKKESKVEEPKMVASTDKEKKVVKKEEKKLDKKTDRPTKTIEFSRVTPKTEKKVEKKKTSKKKSKSFKESVKDAVFIAETKDIPSAPIPDKVISLKDEAVKRALAEVQKLNKDKIIAKVFEDAKNVKVESKGDRKIIQLTNQPTNGKPRFRDVALVEDVQEPVKTEKDEEVLNILRDVKTDPVAKKPTIVFKKGKVVN